MGKRKDLFLLGVLVLVLIALNYSYLDHAVANFLDESKTVNVERVIDGDTVVTSAGEHVRLLGINAPETSSHEPFSLEAKSYLESLVLNKSVRLEFTNERTDKYGRTLAYLFLGLENVNVELVRNGFANYYFYSGRDRYSDNLESAWNECLTRDINLCEPSKDLCASCVLLEEGFVKNNCGFACDVDGWVVKGEGRDKVVLNGSLASRGIARFDLDLSNSGGSLYLRDEGGRLVVYSGG